MTKIINNDFHPSDKGLEADQEDHWGTETPITTNSDLKMHANRSALGAAQAQRRKEGKE